MATTLQKQDAKTMARLWAKQLYIISDDVQMQHVFFYPH